MPDYIRKKQPIKIGHELELRPLINRLREPYEAILDDLLAQGRISDSERTLFFQKVKEAEEKLFDDPPPFLGRGYLEIT